MARDNLSIPDGQAWLLTPSFSLLRFAVRFLRFLTADIPQKIIALLIAVFLWFMAVLDRNYVIDFSVPVFLGEVTTAKIITGFETRTATATVAGKGRDLVAVRLRNPEFHLDIPEARPGVKEIKLDPADLNLPKTIELRAINPETVELTLNEVGERPVEVQVPVKGQLAQGLTITSITPTTDVTLVGPQDEVALFAKVATESLNLASIREDDTALLRVVTPPGEGFSTRPESVPVAITVEKEGARIFLAIPVRIVGPEGANVTVDPGEAQIAVAGPSRRLDGLKPTDITARITIADLAAGKHQLAAEIVLPPGFHLVRCEPPLFDVTIR